MSTRTKESTAAGRDTGAWISGIAAADEAGESPRATVSPVALSNRYHVASYEVELGGTSVAAAFSKPSTPDESSAGSTTGFTFGRYAFRMAFFRLISVSARYFSAAGSL